MAQAHSSHLGTFNDSMKYYFDNGADACKNAMREVFFSYLQNIFVFIFQVSFPSQIIAWKNNYYQISFHINAD